MNLYSSRVRNRHGTAIVIVLCMVVLITFLIMAFFSKAVVERQVSYGNLAKGRTDILARSIATTIVADLFDEMRYGNISRSLIGSTNALGRVPGGTALSGGERLTNSYPSSATNVVPHHVLGSNEGKSSAINLVKMSVAGKVPYTKLDFPDGPEDATKITAYGGSTTIASRNGRAITAARWNRMCLLPETSTFTVPDWIRMTRNGPERLGASKIPLSDAKNPVSSNYVIGRYAYIMANLGGMLDVNMLGNGYSVGGLENATRRRLHQADFTAIRGSTDSPMNESKLRERLVAWRWKSDMTNSNWLFASTNTFLTAAPGHNLLFSRNDLIAFQKQNSDILTSNDLAYLTVGSYEKNQPSFDIENHNAAGFDHKYNQSISRTFYTAGPKKGQRVLAQRFNLNNIDLLKNGSDADIFKYFGLKKKGPADDWNYIGVTSADSRPIRTLSEIARDSSNPIPNFFEILKSVINQNTVGVEQNGASYKVSNGASTTYIPLTQDKIISDYQILQIGANIIDQWDGDDDPTCIEDATGTRVWGIENLPYLAEVLAWIRPDKLENGRYPAQRPLGSKRRVNYWFVPKLWNPNRNAAECSIKKFRFTGAPLSQAGFGIGNAEYWAVGANTNSSTLSYSAPTAMLNATVDLSKSTLDFDSTDPQNNCDFISGATAFSQPAIVRVGTLTVMPGAQISVAGFTNDGDESHAVADSQDFQGPGIPGLNKAFLGLFGGSVTVPTFTATATGAGTVFEANTLANASANFSMHAGETGKFIEFELQYQRSDGTWRTYQNFGCFAGGFNRNIGGHQNGVFNGVYPIHAFTVGDPRCHRASRSLDSLTGFIEDGKAPRLTNTYLCFRDYLGNDQSAGDAGPFCPANISLIENKTAGTRTAQSGNTTNTSGHLFGLGDFPGVLIRTDEPSLGGNALWPMSVGIAWNTGEKIRVAPNTADRQWAMGDADGLLRFGDYATLPSVGSYSFSRTGPTHIGPYVLSDQNLSASSPSNSVPLRPAVLNRAFRNVGELGYVLRDQPWKALNFSLISRQIADHAMPAGLSGDSGLLEVFTLIDAPEQAGKIDLNTGNARVLKAVLQSSESWISQPRSATAFQYTTTDSETISQNMVASTAIRPVANIADLVTYVTTSSAATFKDAYNNARWIFPVMSSSGMAKEQLEAPLRTLSALGTTRTWNLGIDLIVQTGKYPSDATKDSEDFLVESQQRYFVVLIFDRFNGELINTQIEPVYE